MAHPVNFADNYPAVMRHYQFSDFHNGSWYIEIVGTGDVMKFVVQEIRNGEIKRRTKTPLSFPECRKIYWERAHKMSLEAGFESAPPPLPKIDWG